jgi:UV DNA damage endonuclease
MRLGFAVKVVSRPDLPSHDARRWQSGPHLRVSLANLDAILAFLAASRIGMYRMSSDLAPYLTHPDMPQFHQQVEQCADELRAIGARARSADIRLSFHPSQYILLNSPDQELVARSARGLDAQARILDAMGLGPEAVVVTHVGGVYGDLASGRERWVRAWETLSEPTRRRLVLENDDTRYGVADVLWIHERTGVPLVFDYLHHWCLDRAGIDQHAALAACLATWPPGVTPKIHFSSPRTELRLVERKNRATGKAEQVQAPPIWSGHADYLNPFEFISFVRNAIALHPFDVMLESKLKDVALLRLRADLARYAPDLAAYLHPAPPQSAEDTPGLAAEAGAA